MTSQAGTFVFILILLLLSAFFSASEISLISISRGRLHGLVRRGAASARRVEKLRENKECLIASITIGNNLINVLASSLATGLAIATFGPSGVFIATLVMTILIVAFAEILPKTYAVYHADRVALAVSLPMTWVVRLLAPLATTVTQGLLKGLGLSLEAELAAGARERKENEEEDLRGAIELHGRHGAPEERDERAMLRSVLELDEVRLEEVMIHRKDMKAINLDQTTSQIISDVLANRYSRIPLWRDEPENIVGILHTKNLLKAIHEHDHQWESLDIEKLATDPWFVPETTTLRDQLEAFRRRREHFALVVDEYGALMGIVTLEDIIEEIVGTIEDEHEPVSSAAHVEDDGALLLPGMLTLRDFNREYDLSLPDDEVTTLAGLIMHKARRIPRVGESFDLYGLSFQIVERRRNRIALLRVYLPKSEKITTIDDEVRRDEDIRT